MESKYIIAFILQVIITIFYTVLLIKDGTFDKIFRKRPFEKMENDEPLKIFFFLILIGSFLFNTFLFRSVGKPMESTMPSLGITDAFKGKKVFLEENRLSPEQSQSYLIKSADNKNLYRTIADKIYGNFPKQICGSCRILLVGHNDNYNYEGLLTEIQRRFDRGGSYQIMTNVDSDITRIGQLEGEVDAIVEIQTQHFQLSDEYTNPIVRSFVTVKMYDLPELNLLWSDHLMFEGVKDKTSKLYRKIHLQSIYNMIDRGIPELTAGLRQIADDIRIYVENVGNDNEDIIKNEIENALISSGWTVKSVRENANIIVSGKISFVKGMKNLTITVLRKDENVILSKKTWTLDECMAQLFAKEKKEKVGFITKLKQHPIIAGIVLFLIILMLIWVILSARRYGLF